MPYHPGGSFRNSGEDRKGVRTRSIAAKENKKMNQNHAFWFTEKLKKPLSNDKKINAVGRTPTSAAI
jgi:hypothetical protein